MALRLNLVRLLAAAAAVTALAAPATGQGSCTASLLASFTPCMNFLTSSSSTNGGSSPSRDCCRSLAALMSASTGCACLVLAGNVPLGGVPVNRTVAVSLPKACSSPSVPLQCPDTSAQIPAPGPVADTPASAVPEAPAPPVVEPAGTGSVSQGETRPMVLPSSGRRASGHAPATAALVLLLAVGAALV